MSDSHQKQVGVCLTPELITQFSFDDTIAVVIDVLRATTSMCVALDYGANSIIPVLTIEECKAYQDKGFLAAAERQEIGVCRGLFCRGINRRGNA